MAQVIEEKDWIDLGLPGRKSNEIISHRMGSERGTLRYVEIPVVLAEDSLRPMHVHRGVEEFIFVLRGKGRFETPSEHLTVDEGNVIYVPADEPHVTRNVAESPLILMCFFPHSDIGSVTEGINNLLS